ncbi:hypothetical protein E2C01_053950 [Portunus trituberculatus]|uniref:Secreted protein n=1 Tax=Portunus trituberculatus TaxID=210409 RepID=A0A5B7GQR7_PORTR|nr:hypothetical protein [Portunus trituberculatus]
MIFSFLFSSKVMSFILPFFSLSTQGFLPLTPTLSSALMQELTSTLSHSYLSLVNSGTPCLLLYF